MSLHVYSSLLSGISIAVGSRVLAWHTGRKYRQGLCAYVLAELEELIESESARLMIRPDVLCRFPVLPWSYALLPVINVSDTLSVTHASTWETHEFRVQICHGLSQILAQSVTFERVVGEEADHIDVNAAILERCQSQTDVLPRGLAVHGEWQRIPLPDVPLEFYSSLCRHRSVIANQGHLQHVVAALPRFLRIPRSHISASERR